MTCPETAVGAYILGTLDPAERAAVAAHLESCERCRSVRDEFAGLPGMLSRLTPEEAAGGPARPDEPAYRRLMAAAAERRARRRRRRRLLAAAVVLLLLGGLGAGWVLWPQEQGPATVSATSGPVEAVVSIRAADNGSRLSLELRGVRSGERCRLVAVGRDGHREVAGSWVVTYSGAATVTGITAAGPDELVRFEIETFDGTTLVTLPMDD